MSKVVIVGGVAGGMSAATRLRRLDEEAEIIVLEKGPYVSFANCGLPYHLSGEIKDRESLIVQTPEALKQRFKLDVRPNSEVMNIDTDKKLLTVMFEGEPYTESYDKCILATGAHAIVPDIEGLKDAENVFTLRNIPDLDRITSYIKDNKPRRVCVIGAGYIGLEVAENLANRGLKVTIVEKLPQVLPSVDIEMAAFVKEELQLGGIDLKLGTGLTKVEKSGKLLILENGEKLSTDMIIMAIGILPETKLAKEAGLTLGLKDGIIVNEHYETSNPDIYAVGDAIVLNNEITGTDSLISLATVANREGRQVADVISGIDRRNQGGIGCSIVRIFNLQIASCGLREKDVQANGFDYKAVHIFGNSHADYYPGASSILLKLIFDPEDGTIFGAQALGEDGIDKRIDVISTAIKGRLSVFDLPELELCYAPPFGTAKDIVNMAGYTALDQLEGISDNIQWHELRSYEKEGYQLIDVRTRAEFAEGHIKGFENIPLDHLRPKLNKMDKSAKYILSCKSAARAYIAERIMKQAGFDAKLLDGAFLLYEAVRPEEIIYPD